VLLEFSGEIWYWKGPAPHHFVTVPEEDSLALHAASGLVTYGWGMIPARIRIGDTEWTTSLFPRDGGYIVPLRLDVRRAEGLETGDTVRVRVAIDI